MLLKESVRKDGDKLIRVGFHRAVRGALDDVGLRVRADLFDLLQLRKRHPGVLATPDGKQGVLMSASLPASSFLAVLTMFEKASAVPGRRSGVR